MASLPSCLIGIASPRTIERYRALKNLPEYNNRFLLQGLESKIGVPLALVRVECDEDDGGAASDHYLYCFADYSGRPYAYDSENLLAIPVPPAFHQLAADPSGRGLAPAVRSKGDDLPIG